VAQKSPKIAMVPGRFWLISAELFGISSEKTGENTKIRDDFARVRREMV
jgi:hypothetical protein